MYSLRRAGNDTINRLNLLVKGVLDSEFKQEMENHIDRAIGESSSRGLNYAEVNTTKFGRCEEEEHRFFNPVDGVFTLLMEEYRQAGYDVHSYETDKGELTYKLTWPKDSKILKEVLERVIGPEPPFFEGTLDHALVREITLAQWSSYAKESFLREYVRDHYAAPEAEKRGKAVKEISISEKNYGRDVGYVFWLE